jgi:hypothetical protein
MYVELTLFAMKKYGWGIDAGHSEANFGAK